MKVVIIGAGIAGISAGIYSRMNGFDTEIVEMHTIPGGQCTAWSRNGYHFDYCLHWLVGTSKGAFHKIWKETNVLNESIKIIDHEYHSKITDENGNDFYIYADINRWEKYLLEVAPEDEKSITKLCSDMRKGVSLDPFIDPPELRKFSEYFTKLRTMFPTLMMMMKYGKKDCREYFDSLNFKNPFLKKFFGVYSAYGLSAVAFLLMLAWFNQKNAGYLIGGSLPLILRMTDKYKNLGGKIIFGKKVKKIIVENNIAKGVECEDGSIISADYVISAADGHTTIFDMLGGKYLTKQIEEAYTTWELFPPIVQVSFGINKEITEDCPNHIIKTKNGKIGSTNLARGYSFMNYSFDPTMAPKGKTVIVIRYDSDWSIWEKMSELEHKEEKERIKVDAKALLLKKYQGIEENIEIIDVATPITDVQYTGVWKGSYEGFLPTKDNINKSIKMSLPGLNNFYMIGQWLFPGGGLPPSAQSGKWVIQLLCKKNKINFKPE